jgi:hypothetical protein
MNTKIGFLLLLVLLIILMLFYYIDLESNIIILLAVVIVLVIHNLITKREHFSVKDSAVALDSKLDTLISIADALSRSSPQAQESNEPPFVQLGSSCPAPPASSSNTPSREKVNVDDLKESKYKLGGKSFSEIDALSADNITSLLEN